MHKARRINAALIGTLAGAVFAANEIHDRRSGFWFWRVVSKQLFTLRKLGCRQDGEKHTVFIEGRKGNSLQKGHYVKSYQFSTFRYILSKVPEIIPRLAGGSH